MEGVVYKARQFIPITIYKHEKTPGGHARRPVTTGSQRRGQPGDFFYSYLQNYVSKQQSMHTFDIINSVRVVRGDNRSYIHVLHIIIRVYINIYIYIYISRYTCFFLKGDYSNIYNCTN